MRIIIVLVLLCFPMSFAGCGKSKPDPRDRPDFVDTSDPSAIPAPTPATEGGAPPGPARGAK
jgi:hypothetical protein